MRQHNFLFLNSRHSVGCCRSGAPVVSYERRDYKVSYRHSSVAIMHWNSEERAYAVEAYFSSGCSVIATQRAFRNRFNFAPLAPVPDRKSIVTWVIHSDKLQVRQDEELECLGQLGHVRTLRQ